jgi:hypothetical protein
MMRERAAARRASGYLDRSPAVATQIHPEYPTRRAASVNECHKRTQLICCGIGFSQPRPAVDEEYVQDTPILRSVDLPNGSGRLVLFDWSTSKQYRFENLVCLDARGAPVWRAMLPKNSGPDTFVSVELDGDVIRANTWSCHSLTLDRMTGKTLTSVFTK